MTPDPFLPDWNFQVLKELFLRFPHGGMYDTIAEFFVSKRSPVPGFMPQFSTYTGGWKTTVQSGAVLAC